MRILLVLVASLMVFSLPLSAEEGKATKRRMPALGELNPHIMKVLESYPTDGTHAYHWPKKGAWSGNVRTLHYDGKLFLEGDPKGRCYCCGLTFEVFFQAYEAWCKRHKRPFKILDLDLAGVKRLKHLWFGSDGNRKTLLNAVETYKLGQRITKWQDAKPGDFVQLWRHSGSGHSVIFLRWEKKDGQIAGLRYWSTQGSTKGINERTEWFGSKGSAMKRDEFYLVRIGQPVAKRASTPSR